MVYLLNPNKPVLPQLLQEVRRELSLSQPGFIILSTSQPDVVHDFIFPGIETILLYGEVVNTDLPADFAEVKKRMGEKNIKVIKGKHLMMEIFHSSSQKYRTIFPMEIMAATLTSLPESFKYCIENAVWAVDKHIIPSGSLTISIAGEKELPDTAVLIEPQVSRNIIDSKIVKLICHPYQEKF